MVERLESIFFRAARTDPRLPYYRHRLLHSAATVFRFRTGVASSDSSPPNSPAWYCIPSFAVSFRSSLDFRSFDFFAFTAPSLAAKYSRSSLSE